MKRLVAIALCAITAYSYGHTAHKGHWTVHRSNGTTYVAHRHVKSWPVKTYVKQSGAVVRRHRDHGKVEPGE